MGENQKSPLAEIIESRERTLHAFDLEAFFGPGGKPLPRISIRAPVKSEEDGAVIAAHAYAKQRATGDGEAATADPDVMVDAKAIELIQLCAFEDPAGVENRHVYPAFPGAPWIRKHLTQEQLAYLFNLVLEVKRREAPGPATIDLDAVSTVARACYLARHTDMPESILARFPRAWLTQAFVLLAMLLAEHEGWEGVAEASAPAEPKEPPRETRRTHPDTHPAAPPVGQPDEEPSDGSAG